MILKPNLKPMETTFEEKFAKSIKPLIEFEKPDYPRFEIDYYADYVELLSLFSKEDGVSYGDIQDLLFGEPDESTNAEINDSQEAFIDSIFARLGERTVLYSDSYPFTIEKGVLLLHSSISQNAKYYLFLLLSSSLYLFHDFEADLTTDFETVSFETLKEFLPNAIVKQFGKNSEYHGNAKEKIKQLANDIGIPIDNDEIEEISERNNQERGLDVVGWIPFEDMCYNKIIYLGQCACGKKYESKQHDTRRYENYYVFYKTKPQHAMFIPYSLIDVKKHKFYHSDYIEKDYLVFERKRIISLLVKNNVYDNLRSKELVEKCILYNRE